MGRVWDFLFVIWPILASVASCLLAVLLPREVLEKSMRFSLSLPPFQFQPSPHFSVMATRIALLFVGLLFILLPAFRDYSALFPKSLRMTVYFDHNGIADTMNSFPKDELRRLNIHTDWKTGNRQYFEDVNAVLKRQGFSFQFTPGEGRIDSTGETTFHVTMIDRWGIQRYKVVESHGSLIHRLKDPGPDSPKSFRSTFELLSTKAQFIHASLRDVYVRYQIMIAPEFKQVFSVSAESPPIYDHFLTAATVVRVFPYVDISNTLYLISRDGSRIPIGYAIYE